MWFYIFVGLFVGLVGIVFYWILQPYFSWKKLSKHHEENKVSIHPIEGTPMNLNEFLDKKSNSNFQLSLVVPSYNQELRIGVMLEETVTHLRKIDISYEIIVVNDGSKDKTTQAALSKAKELDTNLVVVEYAKNRGKGGAVRAGVAASTGRYILMVDADGATTFSCYDQLSEKIKSLEKQKENPLIMVVGSRRHEEQQKVQRKWYRKFISAGFKMIIGVLCNIKTKDTQCGFKLFTRQSSKILFEALHLERWAFDIELFILCNIFKISTAEVPVEWREIEGSHLNVLRDMITMMKDIILIRTLYLLRIWKSSDKLIVS